MAEDQTEVPENYLEITDRDTLDRIAGGLAARRLAELERTTRLSSFTRDSLLDIHRHLFQDVYPWAGQLRSGDVMAMGIPMCRPQYVSDELDRVMRCIARHPPSTISRDEAVNTVAEHWGELTGGQRVAIFQDHLRLRGPPGGWASGCQVRFLLTVTLVGK